LEDVLDTLGDRRLVVGRELTKLHEEVFRGTVSGAVKHFTEPRGEFTLVIEGKTTREKRSMTEDVAKQIHEMRLGGAKAKEAVSTIAARTGLPRKELYKTWLGLEKVRDKKVPVKT
jgi:16S rRNA (cytidine1402-2'-O)-methyltransferase